ncbi:MAG: hypothetical protein IPF56_06400 [Chloroflexi bacterium]|nr:hypothetical protein [Chloroflexota bacterium]
MREVAQSGLPSEKETNFYQLALPGLEDERQQFWDDTECAAAQTGLLAR